MPGTNQFLPFAVGAGANTLTPTAYAALTSLLSSGFVSGVANSAQFNTALRQATTAAAGLGQFIANQGGSANDDGSAANFASGLLAAMQALFAPSAGRVLAVVSFDGFSGAINYARGVSSVTVNGAGDYTLTFAAAIAAPYAVVGMPSDVAASAGAGVHLHAASGSSAPTLKTSTAVRVASSFVSAGPAGVSGGFKEIAVVIFGG